MKTVLLLTGEAADLLAVNACQALGQMGMSVAVAGLKSSGRLLRLSRYCKSYVGVASTRAEMEDPGDAVLDRVERSARECGAEYVFSVDVPGSYCAFRLRGRLPELKYFPVPEPETLRLMDNKWTFYQFLMKHGLPAPRSWLVESLEQARSLTLPLVLKPLNLWAGLGVHVVRTAAELELRLGGGDEYLRMPVIAQEFVDGQDGSLSFLAENGRLNTWTVHIRRLDGTRTYIENDQVSELGRRIAQASSYTGLANIGLRFEASSGAAVKILECNPRTWASLPLTSGLGVDFIGRGLEMAEGRVPAAIARTTTGECGTMRGILRRLAAGRRLSVCESVCLRSTARDPLPIIGRGVLELFGMEGPA